VRPGDVVALGRRTVDMIAVRHNLDTLGRIVPAWLERNGEATSSTVLGVPMREQIDVPVDEAMVVELYSR
jgi:small subunit ribosomal protein S4